MGLAAVVPRVDSRKEPDRCGWCDGSSASAHEHWGGMAREIYAAAQRVRGLVPWIGLLFHDGAAALDVRARAAAARAACAGARTISHCKFLWIVCGDDARAL